MVRASTRWEGLDDPDPTGRQHRAVRRPLAQFCDLAEALVAPDATARRSLVPDPAGAACWCRGSEHVRGEHLNDGLSAVATGEGRPLVVLPGLGRGADLSVRVPVSAAVSTTALAKGLRRTVHLVHRPLDPPQGMTVAALAGWHATALRERFGHPVDVMGVSGGGVIALQLVLDHPATVRRLVLCVAASRIAEPARRDLLRTVEQEGSGRPGAGTASGLIAHGPLRLLVSSVFRLAGCGPRAPGEAALVGAVQTWDVTERLGEISVPVLVVGGGRDPLAPPASTRATADGIPSSRLVLLPRRGHLTALFDRRVKPAIADFLAAPAPQG